MAQSTRQLTSAVAAGDTEAFAAFYEVWFDRCLRQAQQLTRRDESFCLDVVQETMLRVIRSMRPMDDPSRLEAWMARVVRSAALDQLRREARRVRRELAGAERDRGIAAPSDDGDADEDAAWLRRELAGLTEIECELLRLRFQAGRTLEDAGRATGMSASAAHGRIRRVLMRLRRAVKGADDET